MEDTYLKRIDILSALLKNQAQEQAKDLRESYEARLADATDKIEQLAGERAQLAAHVQQLTAQLQHTQQQQQQQQQREAETSQQWMQVKAERMSSAGDEIETTTTATASGRDGETSMETDDMNEPEDQASSTSTRHEQQATCTKHERSVNTSCSLMPRTSLAEHSMQTERVRCVSVGLEVTMYNRELEDLRDALATKSAQCDMLEELARTKLANIEDLEARLIASNSCKYCRLRYYYFVDMFVYLLSCAAIASLQTELRGKENELDCLNGSYESRERDMQRRIDELVDARGLLTDANRKLSAQHEQLRDEANATLARLHSAETHVADLQSQMDELQAQLGQQQHLVESIRAEAASKDRQSASSHEANMTQLNRELLRSKADAEELRNELMFKDNQIEKMFHEFEKQRELIAELKDKIQELTDAAAAAAASVASATTAAAAHKAPVTSTLTSTATTSGHTRASSSQMDVEVVDDDDDDHEHLEAAHDEAKTNVFAKAASSTAAAAAKPPTAGAGKVSSTSLRKSSRSSSKLSSVGTSVAEPTKATAAKATKAKVSTSKKTSLKPVSYFV